MNTILIYLVVGILLGIWVIPKKWEKPNSIVQQIGIIVTLFAMGVSLGGDPNFLVNLKNAGIYAAFIALGAVVGSVLLTYVVTKKVFKEENK